MPLTKEDLQEIKLVMIETIMEVVPPMVRKIIHEEVPPLIKIEVEKLEKKVNIKLKKLKEEMQTENRRLHQETQNYIFDRIEREHVTRYELDIQVERIDRLEKEVKNQKNRFIVSDKDIKDKS